MPNIAAASNFLDTLNKAYSSVKFTMETECNGKLPCLGIQLHVMLTIGTKIDYWELYALSSTSFIVILFTFFQRMWPSEDSILPFEVPG